MFLIPGGKPLFVEFKAPGEKPRKLQEHIHIILRRLGYEVKVFDSAERCISEILGALEASRLSKEGN
jgi:hypothetical protein